METFVNGNTTSAELPIDATPTAVMALTVNVTANSTKPLFLAHWVLSFTGTMYGLKNGTYVSKKAGHKQTWLLRVMYPERL
ncbi:hypothetical protein [Chitinophaga sp. Ak27]|uniref:hypothetical protein n=1 Tax=Chitinophaga sp. Ak27 TaxID=2726116 RepID=UPI00145CEFE2|nr:hypothetical protein [Chitinophaga sp. Ak27]NLU92334.1 hypothetical protein [Chitinophaga sp. Ak27]